MSNALVQIKGSSGSYYFQSSGRLRDGYEEDWAHLRPMYAHIYVENRCHLKCEHCYESEESHPGTHHVSLEDYDRIFDQLASLGVLVLTFSGGEPFLRKDFLDIVELARSKRFAVRIYTSGTPISEAKADRLAALKVSEVHVSVYSHLADKHDAFTGTGGSWAKSVRALHFLRDRGVRTVLKSNVFTWNADELGDLIALAGELGADYALDPTVKPRMDGDRTPLDHAVSPERLSELMEELPHLTKTMSAEKAESICSGENPRDGGSSMCAAGSKLITVWADGSIAPCALFPVAGGNALEESVSDIWFKSKLFHEVRSTQISDMTSCGSCGVRGACSPCMAYSLIEHDDHRACSSPSRQVATARYQMAERRMHASTTEQSDNSTIRAD
jgi:radical SAM protein with 4Fe4S-binding SPASM domain